MAHPKITVITPSFNTGPSIETALRSVANQTYPHIEHIIIDGGSTDETLPVIREFQKKHPHIKLLSETDNGIYHAMNKGLDRCTGDWINFMGADDEFYNENVLAGLCEMGLFRKEQVVYGNVIMKGDSPWAKDNTVYDGPFDLVKLFRYNICHQAIFYPKSTIRTVGYYQEKYKVTADWDYNVRCFARYPFIFVDRIIACFKSGGKSSELDDTSMYEDLPENVINYFKLDPADPQYYDVTSPFYYPMSRYRLSLFRKTLKELMVENERLTAEQNALCEAWSDNSKTEYDQAIRKLKGEQAAVLDLINRKMDEFTQVMEAGIRDIDHLKEMMVGHEKNQHQ